MTAFRENLLVQFSVVSFVVIAILGLVMAIVLSEEIRSNAVEDLISEAIGASTGRLLTTLTPGDLEVPMIGDRYDRFDEFVQGSIVSERTARVKIWAKDGTVIYSDDPTGVGEEFATEQLMAGALRGETLTRLDVPEDVEHARERHLGTVMEVYTPILFPGDTEPRGAFELYQFYAPVADEIASLRKTLYWSLGVGFVALYGALVFMFWTGLRTKTRQRRGLESVNQCLVNEISERKKAEEEVQRLALAMRERTEAALIQNSRLASIGELVAVVAHEINTPLNSLMGTTELLIEGELSRHVLTELEKIHSDCRRAARIVNSLLSFARQRMPSMQATDMAAVVDRAIQLKSPDFQMHKIGSENEIAQDSPQATADREQMLEVLLNILNNAEYEMAGSHGGGRITIRGHDSGDTLRISISDD